jgi:uncharacterized protein (TIGR00251 family)
VVAEGRIHLTIRLTPKAAKNAIIGWVEDGDHNKYLKVAVTTVPEKGKANQALIVLLSKEWNIPKSHIIIEKGETDRNKILSVPEKYLSMLLGKS